MAPARGVIYVHSATAALCPHIEWALARVLGTSVGICWHEQPAEPGSQRGEFTWTGRPGTSAGLATALRGCRVLRFEVTEDAGLGSLGERYSFTPRLGLFHASTGPNGDIVVGEDRLRNALLNSAHGADPASMLDALLGTAWDAELEPYRYAGGDQGMRWLSAAV